MLSDEKSQDAADSACLLSARVYGRRNRNGSL